MKPANIAKPEEPTIVAAPAPKKRNWCCFIGFHRDEVYREIDIKDPRGIPVMKVIISRCADCGRITSKRIIINDTHYYSN